MLSPVLLLLMLGMCKFAILIGNFMMVENAVHSGGRYLAIARGDSTPLSDTKSQIYQAAGTLTQANLSLGFAVNGAPCATDATCATALQAGLPTTVSASYPCSLNVMGINFMPNCTLSASQTERVE